MTPFLLPNQPSTSLSLSFSLSLCCYINLLAVTPENLKEGDDQTVRVKKLWALQSYHHGLKLEPDRKV